MKWDQVAFIKFMLTLVFGIYVSEAMVNRSLDLGFIAIETTTVYGHIWPIEHTRKHPNYNPQRSLISP